MDNKAVSKYRNHKILLVDDEPNVVEGLKRSLMEEPYTVISAHSADEALSILGKEQVDVVVSDSSFAVFGDLNRGLGE